MAARMPSLIALSALLLSGCSQPGDIRARFVLGWEPQVPLPSPAIEPATGSGKDRSTNGSDGAGPSAPGSGGNGSGGSRGGGAPAPSSDGPSSQVATTGLFNLRWVAGAVPGGPSRPDAFANTSFRRLAGIASAAGGDIYVCDQGMNQIIALPVSGNPSILCGAGDGAAGYWGEDLPAVASALAQPTALARDDTNGVLYVADSGNHRIRHFMPGGRIYTMAGGGPDTSDTVERAVDAALGEVHGLALDSRRNFYFSEFDTGKVRRIDAEGRLTTLTTLTPGATRAVAVSTAGDKLWVAHGATISMLDLRTSPPSVYSVITSPGKQITALAFDQVSTLYYQETDDNVIANGDTRIRALALSGEGRLAVGRQPETVAGSGTTGNVSLDYALPTDLVPDARSQGLAGRGSCSLYIDLHDAASSTVLSGILYTGSSYESADSSVRWSQLARLEPLP